MKTKTWKEIAQQTAMVLGLKKNTQHSQPPGKMLVVLVLEAGPFKTSASFGSGGHPLGYRTKQCVQEIFIYLANGTSNLRRYTSHKYIKLTHFSSNLHGFTIYVVNNN